MRTNNVVNNNDQENGNELLNILDKGLYVSYFTSNSNMTRYSGDNTFL